MLTFAAQTEVIMRDLRMEPRKLPKDLWKCFRKFSLARTPHEQRMHLFNQSAVVGLANNSFCSGLGRMLKASLSLHPKLKEIGVEFVQGGKTQIDLVFVASSRLLRIHQKWINFEATHQNSSCEAVSFSYDSSPHLDEFLCDHVVEDLLELIINEVRGSLSMTPAECRTFRHESRLCMRSMPRRVTVKATTKASELEIRWVGNESGIVSETYGADIQYLVALHKSRTCEAEKDRLVNRWGKWFSLL